MKYFVKTLILFGIWDRIKIKATGEEVYSFAIITTANSLIAKLGFKRMPVMLLNEDESTLLKTSAQLSDILSMFSPYPTNLMNAYPIATSFPSDFKFFG